MFIEEQGVGEAFEFDARDDQARHLLALREGEPVGTLRLRWLDRGRTAKVERVAMLRPARGGGIGHALLQAALSLAEASGAREARLHAQAVAQPFYRKLGFVAFGPIFEEDGIAHIAMRQPLPRSPTDKSR